MLAFYSQIHIIKRRLFLDYIFRYIYIFLKKKSPSFTGGGGYFSRHSKVKYSPFLYIFFLSFSLSSILFSAQYVGRGGNEKNIYSCLEIQDMVGEWVEGPSLGTALLRRLQLVQLQVQLSGQHPRSGVVVSGLLGCKL